MPATPITKTMSPGFYSVTGQGLVMTPVDVENGNDFVATGDMLLIVENISQVTGYTLTITSQPDAATGRLGDVDAVLIADGETRIFRLKAAGWADANGRITIQGQNSSLRVGVVQLAGEV